ncbi:hypothetical protein BC6307_07190 [Sutcliffiella cohnii]|uniref:Uncharacterized protein n=1 Tax=Sutcliffiella cohnii TaxID=33932 RepID=A0A223KNU8_9BACI|nr:hypothetical protein BC6307_07190 [Sutcliffiella cohnii]
MLVFYHNCGNLGGKGDFCRGNWFWDEKKQSAFGGTLLGDTGGRGRYMLIGVVLISFLEKSV